MDYRVLYLHLFNSVTDAIEALEAQNYGAAEAILKQAQQKTKEMYVEAEETDE